MTQKKVKTKVKPKDLKIGKSLPALSLLATSGDEPEGQLLKLRDLKGQPLILYFYPKDNTSGCTQEGLDFLAKYREFKKRGASIFGISRDSLKSHQNFKKKYKFPFELISDPEEKLCQALDVIKEKNMYGKKYFGIERSTFLFNTNGKVEHIWRKVSVKGHVDEVLEALKSLSESP